MKELSHVYARHSRNWRDNLYVYPVISRRSRGLSVGVNLNPDKACNFDCIYCQVDRKTPPRVRKVDLPVLGEELEHMLGMAVGGSLFNEAQFGHVPAELRRINDIAFSGDGEPTASPLFPQAVDLAIELKQGFTLPQTKIIVITDACYLTRPAVREALARMDDHEGEIWAKLDAGTEDYYQLINKPNFPLAHVMENITSAARVRPLVIQALFMRVEGTGPDHDEIDAFCDRLNDVLTAGGAIKLVQVYTIARPPAQSYVTPLSNDQVDAISADVRRRTLLPAESYYGVEQD